MKSHNINEDRIYNMFKRHQCHSLIYVAQTKWTPLVHSSEIQDRLKKQWPSWPSIPPCVTSVLNIWEFLVFATCSSEQTPCHSSIGNITWRSWAKVPTFAWPFQTLVSYLNRVTLLKCSAQSTNWRRESHEGKIWHSMPKLQERGELIY